MGEDTPAAFLMERAAQIDFARVAFWATQDTNRRSAGSLERMPGALNLTEPSHLLAKLEHENQTLSANNGHSYAAINALRDAYHLREWIWHDRLEHDAALQTAVMRVSSDEAGVEPLGQSAIPGLPYHPGAMQWLEALRL